MVALPRAALAAMPLLLAFLSVPPAAAQDAPVFLPLGVDAAGDASMAGVPMLDTWIDINGLGVATVGEDLVFHLGLEGTTTEAGSYCWMAAFEFGGDEYVGLDCYEGLAYESTNAASGASKPDTSRGTNVASSVVFDDTGAVITIPLAAIGAKLGDTIGDIYGLTYATRALNTVDTIPDAKSDKDAAESLGTYVLGGASGAAAPAVVQETLNGTSFAHDFANATSATYNLTMTVPWVNASVLLQAKASAGTANVTFLNNGTVLFSVLVDNATFPAGNATNATPPAPRLVGNATGNWTVVVVYDAFVGQLSVNVTQAMAPLASSTATGTGSASATPAADDAKAEAEVPAPGVALVAAALVAVAVALRRRD